MLPAVQLSSNSDAIMQDAATGAKRECVSHSELPGDSPVRTGADAARQGSKRTSNCNSPVKDQYACTTGSATNSCKSTPSKPKVQLSARPSLVETGCDGRVNETPKPRKAASSDSLSPPTTHQTRFAANDKLKQQLDSVLQNLINEIDTLGPSDLSSCRQQVEKGAAPKVTVRLLVPSFSNRIT